MFLACDVGNSLAKLGFFVEDKLEKVVKIPHKEFDFSILKKYEITEVAISSVNKKSSNLISDFLKEKSDIIPFQIDNSSKFNLEIEYKTPDTLGTDRICGAEGAFHFFNLKQKTYSEKDIIITIDFGTATTVNLIRFDRIFSGGLIAPGISLMKNSLFKKTSQLPEIEISEYQNIIGDSTTGSIASGIINSQTGMINNVISELKKKNKNPNFHIYVTGGNSEQILPFLDFNYEYKPELVLYGIKEIYRKNR